MSTLGRVLGAVDPASGIFIGGRWSSSPSGTFEVVDPADATVVARVSDAEGHDARRAVDAACAAAPAWARASPRHRSVVLRGAFEIMRREADDIAALIVAENGKSAADAAAEVTYAAEFFRWFSEEAVRPQGHYGAAPAGGVRTVVTHRPVGVAALVTPWNFPAAMATRKIAPALAAGCAVVLKPAAETPLTALVIARVLHEAGVPDGVVNVVPSQSAGEIVSRWVTDPRVRKLSFTGSTGVGRLLLAQAADRVMNTSMELGGNAPFIVTADADLDEAVAGAMVAKFRGGGQACTAANRFYVHESVAPQFVDRFAPRIAALRVGPGSDPAADIGPLIHARALGGAVRLIEEALQRGATVAARAEVPAHLTGHFLAPTLLVDVPNDAAVVQEENFAPIAPIVTWNDTDALFDMVNGTELGLAAYVFSRDLKQAMQFAERCEAGMVGVNRGVVSDPSAPFGGVKQSGIGREGGSIGMTEYQETQYLSVDWDND